MHARAAFQLSPYNRLHLLYWLQYCQAFPLGPELVQPTLRIIQTARWHFSLDALYLCICSEYHLQYSWFCYELLVSDPLPPAWEPVLQPQDLWLTPPTLRQWHLSWRFLVIVWSFLVQTLYTGFIFTVFISGHLWIFQQ